MRRLPLLAVLLLTTAARAVEKEPTTFGAPLTVVETTPLAEALAEPEAFAGKEIAVEAVVTKACRKKGCWMVLKDGDREVRVTFKDYGFFVPKTLADRRARVQGTVARQTLSVKDARHFLKDEGASREAIKKVTAPVESVSFVATGVALLAPATAD
ncbi:MAG: DUF4920 domain-containing protein [Elusimicrobiota bacterium]|nr:DUF4920 domain-containing protein [Elusimicrobiota bacterium]